jgi:hypothetical protein
VEGRQPEGELAVYEDIHAITAPLLYVQSRDSACHRVLRRLSAKQKELMMTPFRATPQLSSRMRATSYGLSRQPTVTCDFADMPG